MRKVYSAMKTRALLIAPAALIAPLIGCQARTVSRCPPPPADRDHSLDSWDITGQEHETLHPAQEGGGNIRFGPNNSATNWQDGNPNSIASKTFSCGGNGSKCNITFSVMAPYQAQDSESMAIEFRYGGNQTRRNEFSRQPGAGENPVHISLPSCGTTTITVSVDDGDTPNIQNTFSAGPFYFECADCAIPEHGGGGA